MSGARLDERVVDTLLLQPGQQEVAQPMRRDGLSEASGFSVAQELADATIAVRLVGL